MGTFDGLVQAVENSKNQNNRVEGDYMGEDGLLYCGKCHTRKQSRINILGNTLTPNCLCACEYAKLEEQDALEQQQAADWRKNEREKSLAAISISVRDYNNISFDNFRISENNRILYNAGKHYLEKLAEQPDLGLIFCGSVGTGKTYTAACIEKELKKRNISTVITSFAKVLEQDIDERTFIIQQILKNKVVIIDDLSAERSTSYGQEIIYNVIDTICREGKSLIVTTNRTKAEMLNSQDINTKRIYDRVLSVCVPIEVKGKSVRQMLGKARNDMFMAGMEG